MACGLSTRILISDTDFKLYRDFSVLKSSVSGWHFETWVMGFTGIDCEIKRKWLRVRYVRSLSSG